MLKINCGIIGFGDKLVMSFGNITTSDEFEDKFVNFLKQQKIQIEMESNIPRTMITCPNCGVELEENVNFCSLCGEPLLNKNEDNLAYLKSRNLQQERKTTDRLPGIDRFPETENILENFDDYPRYRDHRYINH